MIAAQNAVVAAHHYGLGSCYIGDIVEQKETVTELLNLDKFVFPISLLVFGYPTAQQLARKKPTRFDPRFIVQQDRYHRLTEPETREMFALHGDNFDRFLPEFHKRKYMSTFCQEMSRSVTEYLKPYQHGE
jgi:hypothetical protein